MHKGIRSKGDSGTIDSLKILPASDAIVVGGNWIEDSNVTHANAKFPQSWRKPGK